MELSKKLIEAIVKECDGDAEKISRAISLVQKIRTGIAAIAAGQDEADKVYERRMKTLAKEMAELRKQCGHWETTFHGDPSGNNDSYNECTICGKSF